MPLEVRQEPSKARFMVPLAAFPVVLPSAVLAVLYAVGARPWVAPSDPASSQLVNALLVGSPAIVWSGCWLFAWDGDPAFPERRMITCGIACVLAIIVYIMVAGAYVAWSVGTALN